MRQYKRKYIKSVKNDIIILSLLHIQLNNDKNIMIVCYIRLCKVIM